MLLGALEAGGTKMVCALGNEKGEVFERESFPTREPEPTVSDIISYFAGRGIEALGVSSFGPLDLNEDSSTYGSITTTPKPGWQNVPLRTRLMDALGVPVGIDTDVNGAALGEALLGAGKGLKSLVYYTIGTGVGGGAYDHGRLLHGLVHPEMGHMLLRPHADDPAPHGFCPYHDGCLEGMACGKAIEQRWGVPARELPPEHIAWQIEAEYLAQMCVNTIVMLSPQRIVLGGGVMHQEHLFPMVRKRTLELLGGYVAHPAILEHIDSYIVPPALGNNSGAVGSLLLAVRALG
ncbi:MAG TPA: ROK family protein [Candidatus Pullichristensenella stercorigallinarum]|uniref:fructokinase n=1 Tax=Candidatus Pullichristensenella stercorigallinarum TaxID=2840909 RepID=A0A9D0ZJP0_9FIRM|nr:ROK family protein [Candidatus Pullichristensenella stercorigallinarum]